MSAAGLKNLRIVLMVPIVSLVSVAAHGAPLNSPAPTIPTLDGMGLASLAGALALAGSWAIARHRANKD